jgi:hypothetical protein
MPNQRIYHEVPDFAEVEFQEQTNQIHCKSVFYEKCSERRISNFDQMIAEFNLLNTGIFNRLPGIFIRIRFF